MNKCEEIDYLNETISKYNYDLEGNIISKKVYNLTNYNYLGGNYYFYENSSWLDQLTRFNDKDILYDSNGNVRKIGNNVTLTWKNGKELNSYYDGNNNALYYYNENGVRTKKILNNTVIDYHLEGKQIIYELRGNKFIYYYYDSTNELIGFKYDGNIYYYLKNSNDDIIGIMDNLFNLLVVYEYDSWGKIISIKDNNGNDVSNNSEHIANVNPFRYRSYYYDVESKLYYLNSRYYNPEWGRFISIDNSVTISFNLKGYNLYSYALNNPINYHDQDGMWPSGKKIKKVISGFVKNISNSYNKAKQAVSNFIQPIIKKIPEPVRNFFTPTGEISGVYRKGSFMGVTIQSGVKYNINGNNSSKYDGGFTFDITRATGGLVLNKNVRVLKLSGDKDEAAIKLDYGDRTYSLGVSKSNGSIFGEYSRKTSFDNDDDIEAFTRMDMSFITIALATAPVVVGSFAEQMSISPVKDFLSSIGSFKEIGKKFIGDLVAPKPSVFYGLT